MPWKSIKMSCLLSSTPPPPFFSCMLTSGHRILGHLTLCQFFLASFQEDQNICSLLIKSKKERRWCVFHGYNSASTRTLAVHSSTKKRYRLVCRWCQLFFHIFKNKIAHLKEFQKSKWCSRLSHCSFCVKSSKKCLLVWEAVPAAQPWLQPWLQLWNAEPQSGPTPVPFASLKECHWIPAVWYGLSLFVHKCPHCFLPQDVTLCTLAGRFYLWKDYFNISDDYPIGIYFFC